MGGNNFYKRLLPSLHSFSKLLRDSFWGEWNSGDLAQHAQGPRFKPQCCRRKTKQSSSHDDQFQKQRRHSVFYSGSFETSG